MRIGVPTEIKDNEFRVAVTPAGVHALVRHGHTVAVQAGAGRTGARAYPSGLSPPIIRVR